MILGGILAPLIASGGGGGGPPAGPVALASADFVTPAYSVGGSTVAYSAAFNDPSDYLDDSYQSPVIDSNGAHHNRASSSQTAGIDMQGSFAASFMGTAASRSFVLGINVPSTVRSANFYFSNDGAHGLFVQVWYDGSDTNVQVTGSGGGIGTINFNAAFPADTTAKLGITVDLLSNQLRACINGGSVSTVTLASHDPLTNDGTSQLKWDDQDSTLLRAFDVYSGLNDADLQTLTS